MYMSLPVPSGKTKVVIQELIDEFVKAEVMEKENAWYASSLPLTPSLHWADSILGIVLAAKPTVVLPRH